MGFCALRWGCGDLRWGCGGFRWGQMKIEMALIINSFHVALRCGQMKIEIALSTPFRFHRQKNVWIHRASDYHRTKNTNHGASDHHRQKSV